MRRSAAALAAASLTILTACGDGDDGPAAESTPSPADPPSRTTAAETPTREPTSPAGTATVTADPAGPVVPDGIETITGGLDVPWDIAFVSDDTALISERNTARILSVTADGDVSEIGTVDGVAPDGEGGLHGIALHEDWLYVYYTAGAENRVVRMPFDGSSLGDQEVIIDGIPKAGFHNGGRILFGPDGMLYIAAGDSTDAGLAQDTGSLAGKILRLNPDGSVPDGNPFDSPVWSYGHRNPQGLAFDDDGQLWASEFGQDTWDELNRIDAGSNYGWPIVEGIAESEDFVDPVLQWDPDDASPSGIAFTRDTIFMAALQGQTLWQVPVVDGDVGEPEAFFTEEFGRLRHAEVAADGSLWVLTSNTDGRCSPDRARPCNAPTDEDFLLRVTLAE